MSDERKPIEDVVKGGDVAMFTTVDEAGRLTSRPLTVAEATRGSVVFLVDHTADWVRTSNFGASVNAAVSSGGRNDWASLTGTARLGTDRTVIDRLWSPAAGAYFDGKDDPRIAALELSIDSGEYWSAPGGGPIGRLLSIVGAAANREVGSHGEVSPD